MAHKYLVDITEEEREDLLKVIHKGKAYTLSLHDALPI